MEFSRGMLRVVVAQVCQTLGWNCIQSTPLELMTDILERYLVELGRTTHRYSEQAGRIEPNLDDLALAFQDIGMSVGELQDYIRHIEPVPAVVKPPQYPVPMPNLLNFPPPQCREVQQREEDMEHVHSHLPVMFPHLLEEVETKPPSSPVKENNTPVTASEESSTQISPFSVGEKRPFLSPGESPPVKRLRTLPDEIYHSAYEMTSVSMTMSGVLTPTRGIGKLPDARTPPQSLRAVPNTVSGKPKPTDKTKEKSKDKIIPKKISSTSVSKSPSLTTGSSHKKDKIKIKSSSSSKVKKSLSSKSSSGKVKASSGAIKVKPKHKIKLSGDFIKKSEHSENLNSENTSEIKLKKLKDSKKLLKKSKDHSKPVKLKSKSLSSSKKKLKIQGSSSNIKSSETMKSSSTVSSNAGLSNLKTLLSQEPLNVEPFSPRITEPPVQIPKPATPPPLPSPPRQDTSEHMVMSTESPPMPISHSPLSSPLRPPLAVEHEEVVPLPLLIKKPPSPSLPLPPRPLDDSSDSEDTPTLTLIIEEEPQPEIVAGKEARLTSYDSTIDSVIRDSEKMMDQEKERNKIQVENEDKEKEKDKERKEQKEKEKEDKKQAREASILESIESVLAQGQETDDVKDVYTFDEVDEREEAPPPSPAITPIKPLIKSPSPEKKTKKKKLKVKIGQGENSGNKNVKHKLKEKLQAKKETSPVISSPEWPKVQLEKVDPESVNKFEFPSPKKQKSPVSSVYSHSVTSEVFTFSESDQLEVKSDTSKKEKKKDKEKKKKNKDKDKDREKKEKKKEKEKHKKDKHREKHKHRDEAAPPIPKLTLKFGGLGGGTPTSTVISSEPSRHHSVKIESRSPPHKLEIPKLVIKKPVMPQAKVSAVLSPKPSPSRKVTPSPPKPLPPKPSPPKRQPSPSPSPPPKTLPSPPPPRVPTPSPPPSSPSPPPSPAPPARSPSPPPFSPSPPRPMFTPSPQRSSPSPSSPAIHIPEPSPSPSPSPPPAPLPPESQPRSPSPPPKRSPSPPPPKKSPSQSPVIEHSPSPGPVASPGKPPLIPPPPPGSSQVMKKRTLVTETVGIIIDPVTGEKIWICPACKLPDDGSPMIGCDKCDDWYHWPCVGIKVEPAETVDWFCPRCSVAKTKSSKKKPARKKKKT